MLFGFTSTLGALALGLLASAGGLGIWFWADLALWGVLIAALRRFAFAGRYSYAAMLILMVVVVFASLMFLGATAPPG